MSENADCIEHCTCMGRGGEERGGGGGGGEKEGTAIKCPGHYN